MIKIKVEKIKVRGKAMLAFHLPQGRLLLPIVGETKQAYLVHNPMLGGVVPFPKPKP